jgi:HK97 family phage prohead protease
MNIQTRAVEGELEVRDDLDDKYRHLIGIVVPWNASYTMPDGRTESFDRAAFDKSVKARGDRIPLFQNHETTSAMPVGMAVSFENRQDGLLADFKMARTLRGDESSNLARDKFVTGLSVGFRPIRNRTERRGDTDHLVRLEAALDHVGFVSNPAYAGAQVLAVRFDPDDKEQAPRLARWRHLLA